MKHSTADLMSALKDSESFDSFREQNQPDLVDSNVAKMLGEIIEQKGLSKSQIISDSQVNRVYAYQIFSGAKDSPNRDKLLALLISMQLSLGEIQDFLKRNGYPALYARSERDAMLIFCIEKGMSVIDINCELFSHGKKTL